MSTPTGTTGPPERAPAPLRWLTVGVAAVIVLLLALPVAMIINREGLAAVIERDTAGTLSPGWMEFAVLAAIVFAIALHLLDVVLLLWLTPRVLRGRRWARLALTVCLVVATGLSLFSAAEGGMFRWTVIPTDTVHVLMIALLWAPPSVRRFFSEHRTYDRSQQEPSGA